MSNKILFNLNANMRINNGACFEEICEMLQRFTSQHLYIEDQKLKSLVDINQNSFKKCFLIGIDNGYILQEKGKEETIRVFSKDLMELLVFEYDNLVSTEESWDDSFEQVYKKTESEEIYNDVLEEEVIIFPKNVEFADFQGYIESSYEHDNHLTKEQLKEAVLSIFGKQCQEEDEDEEEYHEEECHEDEEEEDEEEEDEEEEDEEEECQDEEDEEEEDQYEKIEISNQSSNEKEKVWFRLFLKSVDDEECIEAVNINKKMLTMIEDVNQIDLEETIEISFNKFLERQGFPNSIVTIFFYENVFAEVCIETFCPLSNHIINQIEDEAHLNLFDDVIFFVLRSAESYININNNISNKLNGISNDENVNDIYLETVSLHQLPVGLVDLIYEKIYYLLNEEDKIFFIYDSGEFCIKKENDNLYSVLDCDLYLSIPHLNPCFYSEASSYSELPIAQFYH